MDQYAVFGHPIGHSQSPFIHQAFARQTGQSLDYCAILAPLDGFAESVRVFRHAGGQGANVTMPFKGEAFSLCDRLTERARRAGAVNTLYWQPDGKLLGDTTDGVGLVEDLHSNHISLAGKRILLLGAGGAVRGVLQALLEQAPQQLVIANRTAAKAEQLAADFADLGSLAGVGFDKVEGSFDVIINGTATSLAGELPPLPEGCLKPGGVTYDMAYGDKETPFQNWGRQQGASKSLAGLGMLLQQAAASFVLWRGVRPEVTSVHQALLARVNQS